MSFSNCTFLVIIYHFLFGFSFALFLWGHEPRRWASPCSLGSSELPTRLGGTIDLGEPLPPLGLWKNHRLHYDLRKHHRPPQSKAPPASTIASSRRITTSDIVVWDQLFWVQFFSLKLFRTSIFGSIFFCLVVFGSALGSNNPPWKFFKSQKVGLRDDQVDFFTTSLVTPQVSRKTANSGLNDFKLPWNQLFRASVDYSC